jgi:cell wall-associated protease
MQKTLYFLAFIPLASFSQSTTCWLHLDPYKDNVLGISTISAYEYLKDKPSDTVIVAVIDNGAEVTHEDLKGVIWINNDEIPGDNIDNDNNGYIDDINGWNFLGNAKGGNIKRETTELTRYYAYLTAKIREMKSDSLSPDFRTKYDVYLKVKRDFLLEVKKNNDQIAKYESILVKMKSCSKVIGSFLGKKDFTIDDVRGIKSSEEELLKARDYLVLLNGYGLDPDSVAAKIKSLKDDLETRLNPLFDERKRIIGDNTDDISDSGYGNNNVGACGPFHGTGVASVIGAINNGKGVDGIARKVRLMIIRIVPNGDERDKDFYLAVKYAVDNGASVINCSFAKRYSAHPEFARMAVELAEKAGILIVNGAGNDSNNNDIIPYYPEGKNIQGKRSGIWISVGATMPDDDRNLVASFSNYGKNTIDIFAPGFNIDNCELKNGYGKGSGTSISAPVVTGIAAVLKSYYPGLTGFELKTIIMKSVYKPHTKKVIVPGGHGKKDFFSSLSASGGIANLYNAVVIAGRDYKRDTVISH